MALSQLLKRQVPIHLALVAARRGERERVTKEVERLEAEAASLRGQIDSPARRTEYGNVLYDAARIAAAAGDRQLAARYLSEMFEWSPGHSRDIHWDPEWQALRGDRTFKRWLTPEE